MKRHLKIFSATIFLTALLFVISACDFSIQSTLSPNSVSGKTYVYYDYIVSYSDDFTGDERNYAETGDKMTREFYEASKITYVFDKKNEVTMYMYDNYDSNMGIYSYTQNGNTVTIGSTEYTIDGDKLINKTSDEHAIKQLIYIRK